jgi:squalene-associated FAD-dependent desaturase
VNRRRVLVVGGGLAGITAALGCADAGCEVTLAESRPRLGGLTHSFRRRVGDQDLWVDNGQHVFLRCCSAYRRLLGRLGVAHLVELQPRLDVPVRSARTAATARLRRSGLPAPLHLAGSLARYRWLSPADRVRAMRAALALGTVDRADAAMDRRSFREWLDDHGQSPRAVEALWDLIGVATLNAPADRASLALAATVFQIGLLESADAADLGWSRVPLQQLHGDAARAALEASGVRVLTRARAGAVQAHGSSWLVPVDGHATAYDDVVVATPHPVAEALLPPDALGLPAGWSADLGSVPILNAHVVLDRPVLEEPFLASVDSPLQWVFDRTEASGLRAGQYLAVSVSAADELAGRPVAELRAWALPHLRRLLPAVGDAEVRDFFVTREPHATFRPAPGCARLRPPATTRLPGLHVAGAWTATGWPATMEGAVRSGEAATASVLGAPVRRDLEVLS